MLTTLDFANILSEISGFGEIYANSLDRNKDKCLGVFTENHGEAFTALGGRKYTKTKTCEMSVCVHWTEAAASCEAKANEVMESLLNIRNYSYENFCIKYISCEYPFTLGRDERGICEYALKFKIYYEED